MRGLGGLTGGLVGDRDPAAPLLTLYDGAHGAAGRVELSGATTANWVAKSANLLVDGLGGPGRVGLLLPLHWQTVALLLGAAATGAHVLLTDRPDALAGCAAAFVLAPHAQAALDAGVDDVLAVSGHPLGAPAGPLPPLVQDFGREVPAYGDTFAGPAPAGPRLEPEPAPVPVEGGERLLTVLPPHTPDGLGVLVGALRAGAGLVLCAGANALDLPAVAAAERVTGTAGVDLPGLPRRA